MADITASRRISFAERLGLHPTDYKVLGILERAGPMSAGEIGRTSGLAPASVTNLIDRLVRNGFVRRVRDEADGRKVLVEPDPERAVAASELFASTRRSLSRLWSWYTEDELAVIADFLSRNAERLRQETEKVESAQDAEPTSTDDRGGLVR